MNTTNGLTKPQFDYLVHLVHQTMYPMDVNSINQLTKEQAHKLIDELVVKRKKQHLQPVGAAVVKINGVEQVVVELSPAELRRRRLAAVRQGRKQAVAAAREQRLQEDIGRQLREALN